MSTEMAPDAGTALLALLAYQNLRVAESLLIRDARPTDLDELLPVARIAADALARFRQSCDSMPGGQAGARVIMEPITSPVDEFWAMTRPRNRTEQLLRVMIVGTIELEVVQRVAQRVPEVVAEAIEPSAGLWRAVDHGSQAVQRAILAADGNPDELSLFGRRALGEAAVMWQRLIVRQPALRSTLAGNPDDDLAASSAVLNDSLAAVAARVGRLGLSV